MSTATLTTSRTAPSTRIAKGSAAVAGLVAALGASLWLVLAAAAGPSVLSPPTLRSPQPWLLGPLHGLLGHLSADPLVLRGDLTAALLVLFAGWLTAWAGADVLPLRVVAPAVAAAQLIFLLGPPQPLTDVFNYVVYGRMAAGGLNPYTHPPLAGPHDLAYTLSNWHHLPSPYGPLFTLLFEPLSRVPLPLAYWVWKSIVVASALAALALVGWIARRLGSSPQRAIVFAGLCPVTLAVGIGGFHNDLPAMLCVLGAAACLLRRDRAAGFAAGVLVVAAAGLKPSFALIVPLVVLGAYRRPAAICGAAGAAAIVGAIVLFTFGGALPAVGVQDQLVNPLSLPNVIGALTGHGGADASIRSAARAALVLVVAVATVLVAWRRQYALPAIGLVLLAGVLSLSWIMPWYLAWVLPFAAVARPRVLVPVAVVACLWLGVAGIPQMPQLVHDIGWYPTRSATGHLNHEREIRLVN